MATALIADRAGKTSAIMLSLPVTLLPGVTPTSLLQMLGTVFKGKEIDSIEAGRRLGVGSIVEGSLLKSKDRVRVQLRLVAAADGHIIWSGDSYERAAADIFEVQDEI